MRLSKLKLAGFKTFVDPTTILFPGNLVGVVGPNGCGKSNIIDAVRWVLGESRASALRGESMQDVIFNGSTARKPVSRASVELVFDNTAGTAGGQWSRYGEISVKRVLDRSGQSSYLINNVQVRRKDVIDLFLGTGLGPRAYAIIEQGMISRLIEARPEEIRGFLEEAAGVTKYRERRKETEGRLRDARDNLARLDDICSELGERIIHLEAQAEIAARYRSLNSSHQQKQQLLWLLKRNEARNEQQRLQELARQTGQRIEAHNARLQELEAALEAARETHFDASETVHLAQSEMYSARAEVSRLESELQHLGETRQRIETRLGQLEQDQRHWQQRAASLADEHDRWLEQAESAALNFAQAQARHEELAQQLPEHESERAAAESALAAVRQQLAAAERQQQVEEAKRASAERALASLTQRRARLQSEQQALAIPDEQQQLEGEARLEVLQSTLEEQQAALALAQQELPALQARRKHAHEHERETRDRLATCQARRQALEQLQARVHAGGELGDWLQQHQLQQLQPLWRGLRVSEGWEEAVQAVLRERIAALHGNAPAAAASLLQQPPPASLSLVLALDAETAEGTEVVPPFAGLVPLQDEVEVLDDSLRPLLSQLLQGVFCVAALAPYLSRHAQLAAGSWLVNRQGQLLGRGLLCHLAADASTAGIIEREREIEGLVTEQELLVAAAAQAHEAAHATDRAIATLEEQISHQRRALQQLQTRLHDEQLAALKLSQERERALASAQRLHGELEEVSALEGEEQRHCREAESALQDIDQEVAQQRSRFDHDEQRLQSCSQALHQLRTVEQAAARAAQEAQFAVRECKGKIEDTDHHRQLAAEQLERIAADIRLHHSELEACVDEASREALQEALQQLNASESLLAQRRDELEMVAGRLKQTEELRLRTEQEAAPERNQLAELRLSIQASELTVNQYHERLQEAEADEAALQPLLHAELKESSLQREVSRLAREISELGAVNMAALDELNTAVERKGYLDEQSSDLLQAIDTLEDAIRRIDRETREQLQATFDTVNAHFGELFPQLFGGGRAELVLTGDEILDAGVHIVAQPPGKKNTSIHLLSGGEKALTAIALVFAMFQLNPAPFCMLDEVDAPLDDSNTERYAGMVKRMSMHTQFIFISHSKITMEYAQQLIGVTMQEQGVSRVVEVDIEQALRLAEPAAA